MKIVNLIKKTGLLIISLVLLSLAAGSTAHEADKGRDLMILFTHDLHSYFLPHRILTSEGIQLQQGGYARLAHLINEQGKLHGQKTLLVDAGDFSMGTLFHTAFMQEAFELRLMGKMGYDVGTMGNHDFDFHNDGLGRMLQAAKSKTKSLPALVASNVVFSQNDPGDAPLKRAFKDYPVKEVLVLERNGIRIGLFGLMGKDAADDTPFAKPITFADPIQAGKRMVDILKNREKVDIIICLSHSGTSSIKKHSEDEILARQVPEIDVIISGHTHTVLPQPIRIGKTIIVSSGSYSEYLGLLEIKVTKGERCQLASYQLKNITPDIPEDKDIAADIEDFKKIVNRDYLAAYNLKFDQVIAESTFNMESLCSAYAHPREMGLGNLITDAYRQAIQKAEGKDYAYVHLALDPLGLIRGSFQKGKITVADAFQVLSLGLGPDGIAGYPLLTFYVYGKEVKDVLEVETTLAPLRKEDAHLQVSGVKFTFNPYRILFDRITSVQVQEQSGYYQSLDPDKLYRVCSNLYTARMIEYIAKVTHGIIRVEPKDKNGRPLPNLEQAIVYLDKEGPRAEELKEWIALAGYLRSFKEAKGKGLARIPARYQGPEGRYQAVASLNPIHLIAGGNFITYGVISIGLLLLGIFGVLVRLVFQKIKSSHKTF
ncbi:MAG: bifunctional UDP-sugar hydrolase/5'-nucleotidase [Thermodesulfobacteriota bacterium]